MRRVVWSQDARSEYREILSYLGSESAYSADLVMGRIEATAASLGTLPTGHKGRVRGTYEKAVNKTRYIIAYAIERQDGDDTIHILHLIHSSRDWRKDTWPD